MQRLNVFQQLVRQWDRLHPYNAAQILHLAGRADMPRLDRAWQDTLSRLGLGTLQCAGRHFAYHTLNGNADEHRLFLLPADTQLEDHVTEELNRPFAGESYLPFRPFVKQENGSFYLGLIYQHWIADSASIRMLLHELLARLIDPASVRSSRLRLPEGGYWRMMGPGKSRWPLLDGFLASVRWSSRFKRVRRIETDDFSDFRVRFSLHRSPPGTIQTARASARDMGCTVNDLFLASIARACNQHVPVQQNRKRQDLALGTIVDLRPHTTEDLSDVFGLFLGFTSVVCRPHDVQDFGKLVQTISDQNTIHKTTGFAQASPIRMLAGLVAGKLLSREGTIEFYRKRVPLAGGISNVNLNHTWPAEYHPDPLIEYIRVSPTGPMMPLVFTTTTLGDDFHFGLTVRESIVPRDKAQAVARAFMERVSIPVG